MRLLILFLMLAPMQALATPIVHSPQPNKIMSAMRHYIDYVRVENNHRTSYVWNGHFAALNGDIYDMRDFYRSKRPEINARIGVLAHESARLKVHLPIHFDNGYQADLYEAQPYLGLGVITQWAATDTLVLGFHLHDALQIGGKVRETPCHDSFRRDFHCGTGLPWTDATPFLKRRNVAHFGQFTLNWRF